MAISDDERRNTQQLKDKFFMEAQLRPATADHYQAWLESHLDHGGKVESSSGPFSARGVYTMAQDGALPEKLWGSAAIKIIVPAGVTLTAPDIGHCDIYYIEDGKTAGHGKAVAYVDIIPSMVERGYSLDQLIPQRDWEGFISNILEAKIGGMRKASVADIDAATKALNMIDLAGEAKREIGLDPAMTLPSRLQQAADDLKEAVGESYKAFRYKLDPTSQTPMPSLLKPKVPPTAVKPVEEEATAGTPDKMVVMSPLRLKGTATPR